VSDPITYVYNQTPAPKRLTIGGTYPLASPDTIAGRPYDLETLAADANFGNPQPITTEVQSLLLDGARVEHLRDGNRESYFQIRITADNPHDLARGEAELRAQLQRITTLEWTPPHALAPTSKFIVVTSSMRWLFDDHAELQLKRVFGVTFVCLPHVRSADTIVVDAITTPGSTSPPTITTVDNCNATTGWAAEWKLVGTSDPWATIPVTSYAGTAIKADSPTAGPPAPVAVAASSIRVSKTFAAFDASPYVRFTITSSRAFDYVALRVDDTWVEPILVDGDDYYFETADTSVTFLRLQVNWPRLISPAYPDLFVHDVAKYSRLPQFGTARELGRTIRVHGSERTPGSIAVEHESTALGGHVIVYTHDDASGYTPPLGPDNISGSSSVVSTNVSGKAYNLDTPAVFEKSLAGIPAGRYELGALLSIPSGSGSYDIAWSAQTYVGGVAVGEAQSGTTTITWTSDLKIYAPLARILLPPTRVAPGATATVRISISDPTPGSGPDITLDEAWIFNLSIGALTIAKTTKRRLWIDSADIPLGVPAIWTGDNADRSDAYALSLRSQVLAVGTHVWNPGTTSIFTVTEGVEDAAVSFDYTPCWSHHPMAITDELEPTA